MRPYDKLVGETIDHKPTNDRLKSLPAGFYWACIYSHETVYYVSNWTAMFCCFRCVVSFFYVANNCLLQTFFALYVPAMATVDASNIIMFDDYPALVPYSRLIDWAWENVSLGLSTRGRTDVLFVRNTPVQPWFCHALASIHYGQRDASPKVRTGGTE